jgi:hypothetical protein
MRWEAKVVKISRPAADAIAIDALAFIGANDELLERPGFLRGVMQHLVENEALLLEFAASAGLKPEHVAAAAQALGVRWD